MKRFIVCTVATAFALALPIAAAQDKPADKPAPKEHTMTGCLAKGTTDKTFLVNSTAEKGPSLRKPTWLRMSVTRSTSPEQPFRPRKPRR
jgi:hypothetical protein